MALYPFVHVSALEFHALSRYPGNRQNDRQTETPTNYCMTSLRMRTKAESRSPGLPVWDQFNRSKQIPTQSGWVNTHTDVMNIANCYGQRNLYTQEPPINDRVTVVAASHTSSKPSSRQWMWVTKADQRSKSWHFQKFSNNLSSTSFMLQIVFHCILGQTMDHTQRLR